MDQLHAIPWAPHRYVVENKCLSPSGHTVIPCRARSSPIRCSIKPEIKLNNFIWTSFWSLPLVQATRFPQGYLCPKNLMMPTDRGYWETPGHRDPLGSPKECHVRSRMKPRVTQVIITFVRCRYGKYARSTENYNL